VAETALAQARQILPQAHFELLDVARSQATQAYDLITCAEVIEHLPDDLTALYHLYAMTGKYALFSTVQGRFREWERTIGHVRSYGPGELRRKLEQVGYTIVQLVEWGWPFYSPLYRNLFGNRSVEGLSHGRYLRFGQEVSGNACRICPS
jgi:hypothetical protein